MEDAPPGFTVITNKGTEGGGYSYGEKSTSTEEEAVITTEFIKTNYAALKNLMQEHEKTEKVQAAANEVLSAAEKAQFDKGFFSTPAHKQKQTITPTGIASLRSAKWLTAKKGSRSGAGTTSTEPKRKVQFENISRSDGPEKTRRILFEEDDDVQIYDEEDENSEGEEGEEGNTPRRREKMESLERRNSDLTGPFQRKTKSRFTDRIAMAPRPDRLKMPSHVKTYNGLRDPDDHMNLFCAAAENHRDWTMPVWCHMFEQSLEGPARLWFNSLPAHSIDNFDELQEKFETQFQHQRRYERDPVEIHNIKQGENESILDFLRRFNRESMEIAGATESMRVSGYMHAIRNRQLIEQLNRVVPKTMKEAEQRSRDFVRGKEAAALTEPHKRREPRDNPHWKKDNGGKRFPSFPINKGQGYSSPGSSFQRDTPRINPYAKPQDEKKYVFTTLRKTPCEILATEAVAKKFTPPTPGKAMVGPADKYCDYHQGAGHNTNECFQLRRKIEEAVQSGELAHLVKNIRTPGERNNRKVKINTMGRSNRIEDRRRETFATCREPVIFCPVAFGTASEDALIVQGRIEEITIDKVLVDTGAAADTMYEHFFQTLPLEMRQELRPTNTELETFDGRSCRLLGKVTLPLSFGRFPRSRTEETTFYVVPGENSVDVIFGRPGLRLFEAVPSTVHSTLMIPTTRGVIVIPKTNRRHPEIREGYGGRVEPREIYMIQEASSGWKNKQIRFAPLNECVPTEEALVVRGRIKNKEIPRILIDSGSSTEVMYQHFFETLGSEEQKKRRRSEETIEGFGGQISWSCGEVTLPLTLGTAPNDRTENITFSIVAAPAKHDVILGRPGMKHFGAIASTFHSQMKFPTLRGIATVRGERRRAECLQMNTGKRPKLQVQEDYSSMMGSSLSSPCRKNMADLISRYKDVFAWAVADMTGIPREIAEHRLKVKPGITPIRQKRRSMAPDRATAIQEEVRKLVEADILREVTYQTWVANPVMVPKADGSWRMCIDFKDINKACPKDNYPLPEIDSKVESLIGFKYKCFLDAYKGYHQIKMAKEDEDKTAFYTDKKLYCYKKMPFGLVNAGATYQRLVDQVFQSQMGRNLEVYVDDLVIKSRTEEDLMKDVEETFKTLRSVNMKLNPKKCTFGAEEGRFLGHMVKEESLGACPEKIKAVVNMSSPRSIKEVQSLNGKLTALSRYFSKLAERSLPFFKTLQKCINKNDFRWTDEAEKAFLDIKKHIAQLPELTAPIEGQELLMYLAAAQETISSVLVVEKKKQQWPVYFISKALTGAELNYTPMEKLAYALVHAARRLRRYFQAYNIVVLTELPIKDVLCKPEKSGRLAKWAIELGEHTIEYRPRTAIKGQVLADFIAEVPFPDPPEEDKDTQEKDEKDYWTLFTDGASNKTGSGAGVVLTNSDGGEFTYALRFTFDNTNNEAEYEALLAGLRIAHKMKITYLKIRVDSALVANQVKGEYATKGETMEKYKQQVLSLLKQFKSWEIRQIPREENRKADAAGRAALDEPGVTKQGVLIEVLERRSIDGMQINEVVRDETPNWMTPIIRYIETGEEPVDQKEARKLKLRALRYTLQDGILYKRSYLMPLLRCVGPEQSNYILREIHEGSCGLHQGPRMLVAKANNAGYFWPSMNRDAIEVARRCISCQKHAPIPRLPKNELVPITAAWPFHQWGIDIVGPFPPAPGRIKFLVVAIDYFSKWVEAKPLARITGKEMKKFIWENIVCRYGLPGILISDNGKQFTENPVKKWCAKMQIKQKFTSVAHPQSNGQVERANRSLVEGIKRRLTQAGGKWTDHLSHVLWAHRTSTKTSNGETPFSLTYGTEAVIPAEIGIPTPRCREVRQDNNEQSLRSNLDSLEERREIASINEASYKRKMEQYHNQRVKPKTFKVGDYVWRKNEASLQEPTGKLSVNWEGPYQVSAAQGGGSYKLKKVTGEDIPRTWNAANLKRCYI